MVNTLQEEDRPEPWSQRKKPRAPTMRETRTAAKANAMKVGGEGPSDSNVSKLPTAVGKGRKNGRTKGVERGKGMKKTKEMPAKTANLLLGRGPNPVHSVEEQNRQMEEDARACGRVTRTVSKPATRKSCPTTSTISPGGDDNPRQSPPSAHDGPSTSPIILPDADPSGKP